MTGLELSRLFWEEQGKPAFTQELPGLLPRMAVGLAGEGSECFGFDDDFSRDHDWGPAFCVWVTQRDFQLYGSQIQQVYDSLPSTRSGGLERVGCLSIPNWYHRYTGSPTGPESIDQWRAVPESFFATAVNGAVFHDPLGEFSALRRRLLDFYPEDVRIKKLTARAAAMAQAGQYNYPRCLRRGEIVAAQLALGEFIRAACSMTYLLNRRYAPFYKWLHRGLRDLPLLPELYGMLDQLAALPDGPARQELIEGICRHMVAELSRQGLTTRSGDFLLDHCPEMMEHIQDPRLRRSHIMEE